MFDPKGVFCWGGDLRGENHFWLHVYNEFYKTYGLGRDVGRGNSEKTLNLVQKVICLRPYLAHNLPKMQKPCSLQCTVNVFFTVLVLTCFYNEFDSFLPKPCFLQ